MLYKDPYRIFPKALPSGRTIFYYTTYDDLDRRRQYSTGCVKKTEAKIYCQKLFLAGSLLVKKDMKFSEYTESWFIYADCPYIKLKLMRGFTYSRSHADKKRAFLVNRIIPYFGKISLKKITAAHIEDWLLQIKKSGVSNVTANHYLATLRIILNEAYRKNDIPTNPVKAVQPLSIDSRKKDILTENEVTALFSEENRKVVWVKNLHFLINKTASQTGLRLGEIQALKIENLYKDHILVKHSWDKQYGLKGTKTDKERMVPISKDLFLMISSFYRIEGHAGPFIFSESNGKQPIDHKAIYKWYYRALKAIGIDKEDRVKRNITFHSWRHFANTQLILKGVPQNIIQAVIGHSDDKMTKHYTQFSMEDLKSAILMSQ